MIRFRHQPTFDDYFALHRIVVLRQFRFLIWLAIILTSLYLIYPFVLHAAGHVEDDTLTVYRKNIGVLFIPGLTCFLLVTTYFASRRLWKKAGAIREARDYEFDESGVRVTAESLNGYMEWQHITQAHIQRGYFVLKTTHNLFYYFPVSAVPDPQALSELLARKVSAKKG